MVFNERLHVISTVLSVEYYILSVVILLSTLSALAVNGLSANIPFFEPRPNNISFHVGETATLLCSVKGLHTRFVVWRRSWEPNPLTIGDFVYSPDERISIKRVEEKNEWNLIIKDVGKDDAGVYECAVSSREKYKRLVLLRIDGTSRKYIKDEVVLKPQVVMTGKDFVSKGQTIFLMCNASGEDYAPDGVDWFINGRIVNQNSFPRVRIYDDANIEKRTLVSTLEIKHSLMSDKGIYVCRGPDSKTDSITVHILDEEKSSIDKRGFVNDSSIPCCSFHWSKQCSLLFICLSATWFTHTWFVT